VKHALLGRLAIVLATALVAPACDGPTSNDLDPDLGPPVDLIIRAEVGAEGIIALIVVEVTGTGIPVPIVANFPVVDQVAQGTIVVPAGNDRLFRARAFDATGNVTHEGMALEDVRPTMDVVRIPLTARGTGVPIEATISGFQVQIDPVSAEIEAGEAAQFTATVTNGSGTPIAIEPADLTWASTNPAVVQVDANGLAIGWYQGIAQIVVSYEGVAAAADIAVDGVLPATTAVRAGESHTCGLTSSGTAYCWGSNDAGQLGDGTTTNRFLPTMVSGGHTFAAIAPGWFHTCGLRTDGALYCWGLNTSGQLGDGTAADRLVPTAVTSGQAFSMVAATNAHTCAVATDGAAYCWGANGFGQLGDGSTAGQLVPTAVSGGHIFASISGGLSHTCGLRADGAAFCWGRNTSGQLGDATTTTRLVPTPVVGEHTFASLNAQGDVHTCAVRTDSAAYCWGGNDSGQLGDGTTGPRVVPTAVSGGYSFTSIGVGGVHTCGLVADGSSFCWGAGNTGQLGDGSTLQRLVPTAVAGDHTFASISAGGQHTCAARTDGTAFCWGLNGAGQLGDGTSVIRLTPTQVSNWIPGP
jgi:alpha-tubulin suppressor-like RCC1 family protein